MVLLLCLIYVMYIGLGIPDSMLGASWPAVFPSVGASIGQANYITIVMALFSAGTSFFSARIINKLGTPMVTLVSTFLTAIGILGFSFSNSLVVCCICAIPLGLGAGAIDAALNNFVALNYDSKHLHFLHGFYGVGVIISPYVISFALSLVNNWRVGYRLIFLVQIFITLCAVVAIPLWKKAKTPLHPTKDFTPITLSIRQMLKIKPLKLAWLLFFSSVALEFTCSIWASTYLYKVVGFTEAFSAECVTFYFIGIASIRFISGFISSKVGPIRLVIIGHSLVGVAIVSMFLPIPAICKVIALFTIGFGNGLTYPTYAGFTPKHFGERISQSVMSSYMIVCNLAICLVPTLFGVLADSVGVFLFPLFIAVLFVIMFISMFAYNKSVKGYKCEWQNDHNHCKV